MKTKYTEENIKAIVDAIRIGVKIKHACQIIPISTETYFTWIKERPDFEEAIKKAQGERIKEALMIIRKSALKSWQAAAWYLERTMPDQYGMRTQISGYLEGNEDEAQKKERTQRITRRMNELIEEQVKAGGVALGDIKQGMEVKRGIQSSILARENFEGKNPLKNIEGADTEILL